MKKAVLAAATILAANAAVAAPQKYAGGALHFGVYDEEGLSEKFDSTGISLNFGLEFNENLALEFRYMKGFSNKTTQFSLNDDPDFTFKGDTSLDDGYSLLLKPMVPVANGKGTFYGLIGYSKVNLDFSIESVSAFGNTARVSESASDSGDGLSVGLGAAYNLNDAYALHIEWINYVADEDDATYSAVNLGFSYDF